MGKKKLIVEADHADITKLISKEDLDKVWSEEDLPAGEPLTPEQTQAMEEGLKKITQKDIKEVMPSTPITEEQSKDLISLDSLKDVLVDNVSDETKKEVLVNGWVLDTKDDDKRTILPSVLDLPNTFDENGNIVEDITAEEKIIYTPNLGVSVDNLTKDLGKEDLVWGPDESNKIDVSNGDGLAVTPEKKQSFIDELIKKVDPTPIVESSPAPQTPKQATHYARRNVAPLREKVAQVLSSLDAINIEARGVYKCKPDKPIKN